MCVVSYTIIRERIKETNKEKRKETSKQTKKIERKIHLTVKSHYQTIENIRTQLDTSSIVYL